MVQVTRDAFLEASREVTEPGSGAESLEFVLEIARVHDSVTVTEAAAYQAPMVSSATKTLTALRDVPQSVTVVSQELIKDQMMMSIGDVVRYVPGITAIQGENNRDQLVIRGNSTSADFFVDGVRDDVQYYRDLYNLDRVEALKGPNAMMFGRGGGGVVNRVTRKPGPRASGRLPQREVRTATSDSPPTWINRSATSFRCASTRCTRIRAASGSM
jgi:catecholate siderophore receptor